MRMYALRYRKTAIEGLRKMLPKQRQQMVDALQASADGEPQSGLDVRALTNRPGYRLRIGQWRAIYERRETEVVVLVLDVGPRGEMYI